jgi:hypothetical protein
MGGVCIQPIRTDGQRVGYAFGQRINNSLSFLVAPTELLAARDSDVLFTVREQKHLLHHRGRCHYHRRPQSAARFLAQG